MVDGVSLLEALMEDSFKNREHQFEAKFAHDQELEFKMRAHRNHLFASWVTDQMGDGAPPDYAEALMEFALNCEPAALIERARLDLHDHGLALADIKIRKAFEQCEAQAHIDVNGAPVS
jgi:hypothetical protein